MKIVFGVILLYTISGTLARSKLEQVIRNYETKYGLIFDASSSLARLPGYGGEIKRIQPKLDLPRSILQLAMDLNKATDIKKDNQITSPVSITSVLGELLLAADGGTFNEIQLILGASKDKTFDQDITKFHEEFGKLLDSLQKSNYNRRILRRRNIKSNNSDQKVFLANGIFIQQGINLRHDYQSAVERIYKSEISHLDFRQADGSQAQDYINNWVERKTHGKIRHIISEEISQDMKMIIVNALYFHSTWETPFLRGATTRGNFYPDGMVKSIRKVPMMTVAGIFPFYESKEHGCRIIGLPYKGGHSVMYVILPNESNRRILHNFQTRLKADVVEEWIQRAEKKSLLVTLPKMHLKSSVNLKETLQAMGLSSLFDSKKCDLSLMVADASDVMPRFDTSISTPNHIAQRMRTPRMESPFNSGSGISNEEEIVQQEIFVEDILHNVDLNISEEGTEGAATTSTVFGRADFEEDFVVNRPFLFLLRHTQTRLPLFYGSVVDPRQ